MHARTHTNTHTHRHTERCVPCALPICDADIFSPAVAPGGMPLLQKCQHSGALGKKGGLINGVRRCTTHPQPPTLDGHAARRGPLITYCFASLMKLNYWTQSASFAPELQKIMAPTSSTSLCSPPSTPPTRHHLSWLSRASALSLSLSIPPFPSLHLPSSCPQEVKGSQQR